MILNDTTHRLLSGLIDQTTTNFVDNSSTLGGVEKLTGKKYVSKHLVDLKKNLLEEIKFDGRESKDSVYVSLNQVFNNRETQTTEIKGTEVNIYNQVNRKNTNKKYLVNIVFPCRNSSKIVHNSIKLLVSEIRKAYNIDFSLIFQVNNTSDNTIKEIVKSLRIYDKFINTANFYILEADPGLQLSLPGSLNLGFHFIRSLMENQTEKYKEIFLSFWDDELLDLIPTPDSLFNSNLNELLTSQTNKAISGYMIDNRMNISIWHELSKGFSSDIRFIHSKPYLHGGSGTVMRLKDYPSGGIKLGGIADTDLSEHLLKEVGYETLNRLTCQEWPVRSNPNAPVFHPIENDILKWTIKYLMYQISWENTLKALNKDKNKIGMLWKKRIDKNRRDFHKRINNYLINLSPEKIIDREFMHFYYLTVQDIKNKKSLYKNLKAYRNRSLEIK